MNHERELRLLERRRRGEPTLPLPSELAGLSQDEQVALISRAAAIEAAWWRERSPAANAAARRELLKRRVTTEVVRNAEGEHRPTRPARPPCPWCGRACAIYEPACLEHAELEREFLQAAGDGWG